MERGGRGCSWLCDIRVRLMVLPSVGGWFPVAGKMSCKPLHTDSGLCAENLYFGLVSVAFQCYSDFLHRRVSGLVVRDSFPISVGDQRVPKLLLTWCSNGPVF